MNFLQVKKYLITLTASVLVLSFIFVPVSQTLTLQKAEALIVHDPGNAVINSITAGATSITAGATAAMAAVVIPAEISIWSKEFILDTILWILINAVIQSMIRSVTAWVNSGFNGSPAFIDDLQGFLIDIADQVVGDFLIGTPLELACSPFKVNIQLALKLQFEKTRGYKSQCRLSSVVKNMQGFLNGNFMEGGFDGLLEVASNPQSNPYGHMLEAEASMSIAIANAQGRKITVANWGAGFMPKDKNGKTVTPGVVVETQLNEALGLPNQRIAVADEINELLGALFSQLVGQIFSSGGGLRGLTDSSYGSGNYFEQMKIDELESSSQYSESSQLPKTIIADAITAENEYQQLQGSIISMITEASTYKSTTYPDTNSDGTTQPNTCHTGELTPSLTRKLNLAYENSSTSVTHEAEFNVLLSDYDLLENPNTPTTTKKLVLEKYDVDSVLAAQGAILNRYISYYDSGKVRMLSENIQIRMSDIPDLRKEVQSFTASIDSACRENNSGGN